MKLYALICAAALGCASPAIAADIYTPGSLKDAPFSAPDRADHSGFSVRAFVGYAWGDRDVKTDAKAFLNCVNAYELSENAEERAAELKEIEGYVGELNKAGIFASTSNNGTLAQIVVPLIGAAFSDGSSDEFGSLVFGAEAEYLWHRGQFGVGIAAGATFYGDASTKTSFSEAPTHFAPGSLFTAYIPEAVGEETGLTVSGYTSVDRDFDIDLALKLYWFASHDTAFYIKAGPSFAKASIKTSITVDGTDAGLRYSSTETAIGYVLGAGVTHWIDQNWSVSLDGDWKQHSFDASGSKNVDLGEGGCFCDSLQVQANGKTEVEDSVFAIKAGLAYHW